MFTPIANRTIDQMTTPVTCFHQSGYPLGTFELKLTNTGFGYRLVGDQLYCFELNPLDHNIATLVSAETVPAPINEPAT